ncbi:MAG: hypothetical protein CVU95_15615 [Firmicutes bacterium HGW-Firmicutes-2]|jgi:hypothetical protein|nr:MAG: hypothetical protein CVU95_15615 [Firmicutes bacterium HGW-Firmicutes-2]
MKRTLYNRGYCGWQNKVVQLPPLNFTVPVSFFEAVKAGEYPERYFASIEPIMLDKEEDVQKVIDTFLRES